LALAGYAFQVLPSKVLEKLDGGPAAVQAKRLALAKARQVASVLRRKDPRFEALVLGADTLVWLKGRPLAKPSGPVQARAMLSSLSGQVHAVVTGVALAGTRGREVAVAETTKVFFRKLGADEIDAYVRSGEPLDKAGAYAIQGGAAGFIRRIEGDYTNVVGLPLARLAEMLKGWEGRRK
jgi:septum formation protein